MDRFPSVGATPLVINNQHRNGASYPCYRSPCLLAVPHLSTLQASKVFPHEVTLPTSRQRSSGRRLQSPG